MNANKQKELMLENGQLKIRNRALEDQLAAADRDLSNNKMHLATVCLAFKKYIKATSAPAQEEMTDEQAVAILNTLVQKTVAEMNTKAQAKEKRPK